MNTDGLLECFYSPLHRKLLKKFLQFSPSVYQLIQFFVMHAWHGHVCKAGNWTSHITIIIIITKGWYALSIVESDKSTGSTVHTLLLPQDSRTFCHPKLFSHDFFVTRKCLNLSDRQQPLVTNKSENRRKCGTVLYGKPMRPEIQLQTSHKCWNCMHPDILQVGSMTTQCNFKDFEEAKWMLRRDKCRTFKDVSGGINWTQTILDN